MMTATTLHNASTDDIVQSQFLKFRAWHSRASFCASSDDIIRTLGIVKSSVANGELDAVIEAASVKVRERFGKSLKTK